MNKYDAIVIGAGPGGYVCAIRLAQLGNKTAIVEKGEFGGVCLNVGCIPSKALIYASSQYWKTKNEVSKLGIEAREINLNLEKMQEWKNSIVKKLSGGVLQLLKRNGVEIFQGQAVFKDANTVEINSSKGAQTISGTNIVIATGSRETGIPGIKGKKVMGSTQALSLTELPEKLLVIGGGFIGVEMGSIFAKLGSEVTIVEVLDTILNGVEPELVNVVKRKMKKFGINVLTGARVGEYQETESYGKLEVETSDKIELSVSQVLVSVGRKPNSEELGLESIGIKTDSKGQIETDQEGRTNIGHIYAIGDVTGPPQLAHRASMDGLMVAAVIAGEKSSKTYKTIPWAIFSDPEIAVCGLSEEEAKNKGLAYKVGRFPFAASGRALSTNETDGFIKVLVEEKEKKILGVHIVGPEASNLIAEAALAIEMGAGAEDVIGTIHTHPTLPEVFPEALEDAFSKAIHIYKPKRH